MKRFIDKILDVPKLIRTIWLMLWIILIILLVLKFCFNQWYPVVIENQWFKNLCDFIDNNKIVNMTIMGIFYELNSNIVFLTNTNKKKYSNIYILLFMILLNFGLYILKLNYNNIGTILELILIVIIPIIINFKKDSFKNRVLDVSIPIVIYILINLWQFTIYFVRGLNIEVLSTYPSLIYIILQLDYYIFTMINWIGVSFMGALGIGWLWTRDVTILKAERQRELAKAKPDMDKVFEINARIEKLEKEGK